MNFTSYKYQKHYLSRHLVMFFDLNYFPVTTSASSTHNFSFPLPSLYLSSYCFYCFTLTAGLTTDLTVPLSTFINFYLPLTLTVSLSYSIDLSLPQTLSQYAYFQPAFGFLVFLTIRIVSASLFVV